MPNLTQMIYEAQRGKGVKLDAKQGTPLSFAQSAVHHVRRVLPIRESNRQSNVDRTDGLSSLAVSFLRAESDLHYSYVHGLVMDEIRKCWQRNSLDPEEFSMTNINSCISIALTAATGVMGGAGNCGEQSAVVFVHLIRDLKCPYTVERYHMENGDHCFVVINRPKNSNPAKFNTWGNDGVVSDPWYNRAFVGSNVMRELPLRKGTPTIDLSLSPSSLLRYILVYAYELYIKVANELYAAVPHASPQSFTQEDVDEIVEREEQQWGMCWYTLEEIKDEIIKNEMKDMGTLMKKIGEREKKFTQVLSSIKQGSVQLKSSFKPIVRSFATDVFDVIAKNYLNEKNGKPSKEKSVFIDKLIMLVLDVQHSMSKLDVEITVGNLKKHLNIGIQTLNNGKLTQALNYIKSTLLSKISRNLGMPL